MSTRQKVPIVAIVGRANVGKSSIFNTILGRREAIVAMEAGTTRDSITAKAEHGGKQFWLVDTAGMKHAEDDFELTIQEQIVEAADAADIILVAVEAHVPITEEDRRVATLALKSRKPVLLIVNKADQAVGADYRQFQKLGIKEIFFTSVPQKQGFDELFDHVVSQLPAATIKEDPDRVKVALLGRPNVGKSSLFNALAKKQQAIVADRAGTTRDINRAVVRYNQREIELMDTAGIRRSGKIEVGIEKFSVLRALQAIEEADVCLFVMDATELNTQLDQKIAGLIKEAGKGLIIAISKWDIASGSALIEHHHTPAKQKIMSRRAQARKAAEDEAKEQEDSELRGLTSKDPFLADKVIAQVKYHFQFASFSSLIFTSSVTGQNVSKLYDLILEIAGTRTKKIKTSTLNTWLKHAMDSHPPAGLKNRQPKLNYMTQTDDSTPTFMFFGAHTSYLHWSYKRYLERELRREFGYEGTPVKMIFTEKHVDKRKQAEPTKDWKSRLRADQLPKSKQRYSRTRKNV